MSIVPAGMVLDQLEGATIVSSYVEDDEGMHLVLEDGRILIIAGMFTIGLYRVDRSTLN